MSSISFHDMSNSYKSRVVILNSFDIDFPASAPMLLCDKLSLCSAALSDSKIPSQREFLHYLSLRHYWINRDALIENCLIEFYCQEQQRFQLPNNFEIDLRQLCCHQNYLPIWLLFLVLQPIRVKTDIRKTHISSC